MDANHAIILVMSFFISFLIGAVIYFASLLAAERKENDALSRRCRLLVAEIEEEQGRHGS